MYRSDWHIYIHMNDYDGSSGHDKLMEMLEEKVDASWELDSENRGGGELYAYVSGRSLNYGLETGWNGDFPKKHSFTVEAVDENEEMSLTWKIEGGRCISYTDEEGHEKLEGYHYTETDGKAEDVLVDGKWRTIRFYAREGASPDGDGRYGDYICVVSRDYADDFIIWTAPGEGKFGGVYIHEGESRESVEAEYVDAYIKNGKEIWAGEAACTEEDLTDALEGIIQKCEDKKDGADAGSTLFRFRLEETKPLASVTIPDGETTVSGTAFWNCTSLGSVSIPASVRTISDGAFYGCRSLREVHFGGTRAQWFILKGFERITEDATVHCSDGDAVNPKTATEYVIPGSVTEIGYYAFRGCTSLASVSIPEGVTKIGSEAFRGCTSLASVTIPASVTEIDNRAFEGCTSLASVSIPASVKKIGTEAFKDCTSLAETSYAGSRAQWFMLNCFRDLPENTVVHCSDGDFVPPAKTATEYVIPEGVTKIGGYAFDGCTALASVTIPASVMEIDNRAFKGCTSLASVSIPASMTKIGGGAFEGCTALKEVRYGGTQAQWFMLNAFNGLPETAVVHCSDGDAVNPKSATEYVIPEGVTKIGNYAFEGYKSLASVSIPEGVTEIGQEAFDGCTSLKEVRYGGTQAQWFMLNGFRAVPDTAPVHCSDGDFVNPKTTTEYVIPDSVTEIGWYAFKGCTSLASVTIPGRVTKIGYAAFKGCTSLASVTIPEGVTKIVQSAFDGCTSLASVSIPEGVTEIDSSAFSGCTSLASVSIPAGVRYIREAVFKGCTALTSVSIPAGVTYIAEAMFDGCTSLASVTIPEGVTEIDESAFSGCTALASLIIPESMEKIGKDAFNGCTSLKEIRYGGTVEQWEDVKRKRDWYFPFPARLLHCSDGDVELGDLVIKDGTVKACRKSATEVVIPEGVRIIDEEVFSGCGSLRSVSIPEGVEGIYAEAFKDCTALASITIPASVTCIGNNHVFKNCNALKEVLYTGTQAQWFMLQLFRQLPDDVAVNCSDGNAVAPKTATEYVIPEGVTGIGGMAFYGCTAFASVSIPEGVTYIGYAAFQDCTALASVSIPEGVTKIVQSAFQDCESLASVIIPASVTEIGHFAFKGCTALTEIHYEGSKKQWAAIKKGEDWSEGVPAKTMLVKYNGEENSITLPEGMTKIGDHAFEGFTLLKTVTIPASVEKIGEWAFSGCTALASVNIPEGVTAIGDSAFLHCFALAEIHFAGSKEQWEAVEKGDEWHTNTQAECIRCSDGSIDLPAYKIEDDALTSWYRSVPAAVIPEGVKEIGEQAFCCYELLCSVTIPASVTEIGEEAFSGCTALAEIHFAGSKAQWGAVKKGDDWNEDVPAPAVQCADGNAGDAEASGLIIEDGVLTKFIGSGADVAIPGGVTKIGKFAFRNCTSLTSVTISEGMTEICGYAFYHCTSLSSVTIPKSVTEISSKAFAGCTSLAEIHYAGTKDQWAAVKKGNGWNEGVPAKEVLVRKQ